MDAYLKAKSMATLGAAGATAMLITGQFGFSPDWTARESAWHAGRPTVAFRSSSECNPQ